MYNFIFDIDDTVYDQLKPFRQAFDKNFQRYSSIPITKLYLFSRKFSDALFDKTEKGEVKLEDMQSYRIIKAFEMFDIQITQEQATKFQNDYQNFQKNIGLLEDIRKTLDYCKEQNVVLGIISNGPSEHQRSKIKQLNLERWVPKQNIFISDELKIAKPDVRIFKYVQNNLNILPESTYYIGDSYENDMIGAKKAGWKAIWSNRRNHYQTDTSWKPDYVIQKDQSLLNIVQHILNDSHFS